MCNAMLNLSVTVSASREEERGRSLPLFFLVRRLWSPTLVRNCSFESSKTISPPLSDCYMLQGGYENKSDVGVASRAQKTPAQQAKRVVKEKG